MMERQTGGLAAASRICDKRILVVDDEPMMGATLRVALGDEHDVVVVGSGEQARELLERDRNFEAIVCDLMMPDVSGMDLHAWLDTVEPHLARRMIFMTGGAYTDNARRFLDRVGNAQVQKPFDVDDLLGLVRDVACAG